MAPNGLLRGLSGIASIPAGLIWVSATFLFGGKLIAELQRPHFNILVVGAALLLTMLSVGLSIMFAAGVMSLRTGPARPKLWWACICLAIASYIGVSVMLGSRPK
jgi:membrane protein DedA with SNARE-associated domain